MAGFVDSGVHPLATVRVLGVVAVVTAVLYLGGWAVTRSVQRGAVVASAAVLLLLSADFGRLAIAALLMVLAFFAARLARRLTGRPRDIGDLTAALNAVTLLIFLLTCVRGFGNQSVQVGAADLLHSRPARGAATASGLPDIDIVLLDGYPRADTLERLFDFDNGPFLQALEQRGFRISAASHSNYMFTDLTLTAMFNGRHLVDIPNLQPFIGADHAPAPLRQALNAAAMLELLRQHGYTLVSNATVGEGIALRDAADVFKEGRGLNEYERYMLESTIVGHVAVTLDPVLPQDLWRTWVEDGLGDIPGLAEVHTNGPKVVFTHVPSPHLPIVFSVDGGPADPAFAGDFAPAGGSSNPQFRSAYIAQLQYVNQRILKGIDQAAFDPNTIVILMSDHGSESNLDWYDPTASDLRERFSSFFAARTPGIDAFPDDIDPTNVLVGLVNQVLHEDVPAARDRFFVSQGHWVLKTLQEISSPFGGS